MTASVALFLQMESSVAFEAIARCMPVWVADIPANAHLRDSLRLTPSPPPATWFPLKDGETLDEAAVRIAFSLDDHHNDLAQKDGYRFLLVFGARYTKSMDTELRELEFKTFESTPFGFVAAK
jgi:hypothetical protein